MLVDFSFPSLLHTLYWTVKKFNLVDWNQKISLSMGTWLLKHICKFVCNVSFLKSHFEGVYRSDTFRKYTGVVMTDFGIIRLKVWFLLCTLNFGSLNFASVRIDLDLDWISVFLLSIVTSQYLWLYCDNIQFTIDTYLKIGFKFGITPS